MTMRDLGAPLAAILARDFGVRQGTRTVVGIAGYKNGTPFSLGRQLRDVLSAPLMISNDRILSNTANLLLVQKGSGKLLSA